MRGRYRRGSIPPHVPKHGSVCWQLLLLLEKNSHCRPIFLHAFAFFALSNRFLLVRLSETSMACWQSGQMRVAVTHLVLPTEVRVLYTPR